ncbi:hypothetical protein ROG8370_03161 [Roseovarius gaetbuli]|uniref:Uncharacterized protein n=1 Tax=Roseovarius gaetbuli TaxID=1356575 RepID=A0A1X7A1P2_9RHOB|nr:hypothetical protein ROG8370_03161 [Roseovarius gaetbuli]
MTITRELLDELLSGVENASATRPHPIMDLFIQSNHGRPSR